MRTVTLANLAESTAQEVFDTVVHGLAAQGFERAMAGTLCVYRDAYGSKCAAGQLMTDEEYARLDSSQRLCGWHELVDEGAVPSAHEGLIRSLQNAHDEGSDPADMHWRLRCVASESGLKVPAVLKEGRYA